MGCKPQADNQPFITEYLLLIAEDGICELRVKAGNRLDFRLAGLDDRQMDGIVGVASP